MKTDFAVYPNVKRAEFGDGSFDLTSCKIFTTDEFRTAAYQLRKLLNNLYGIFPDICAGEGKGITFKEAAVNSEEYKLEITNASVIIEAGNINGALYGAQTLVQLINKNDDGFSVPAAKIEDKPYMKYRAVHLYVPPKEGIDGFKRILDALCFLKYNTVILEVGGGMEYERHPEVNKAWEKFCDLAENKFPGGPRNIQWADRYWKDSLHTELAGGSFLTKNEMRGIVDYGKKLGLQIIPEIQALSHCYYLTLAHREIAEQQDDPFPDTYCPSNEESYQLYFDIADEVIEVFEPEIVSIGHDEIRILGECFRCKGKTGHELLAYEINRLHEFYSSKNIKMAMWGEKLQLFTSFDGQLSGGNFHSRTDDYGRYWEVLATHEAIDKVPNDILMLDWYHSKGNATESCFTEKGFEVIYGNFHGSLFASWDKRSKSISGAEISSWCLADEPTLGRNGIMFEFMFSAALLWQNDYHDELEPEVLANVFKIAPIVRSIARGYTSPIYQDADTKLVYTGDPAKSRVTLPCAKSVDNKINNVITDLDEFNGVPIDTGHIYLDLDLKARSLMFLQACTKQDEFRPSIDFADKPEWQIATYAVFYEDGTVELANVHYGIQCADINMSWTRQRGKPAENVSEIDDEVTSEIVVHEESPYFKIDDRWRESISYFTTPIRQNGKTLYAYEWINPKPNKKITAIKPINTTKDPEQTVLLFAIAAVL